MYSKTELLILRLISKGCTNMESISAASGLSSTGLYAVLRAMREDGLLSGNKGIEVSRTPYHARLIGILESSANAIELLSDGGMGLLSALREPKTANQLIVETGLSKASVYRRIKTARSVGAVTITDDGRYVLNDALWPGLRELFDCKDDMDKVMDTRAPFGSRILYSDKSRVLYSSSAEADNQVTGLTFFENNGFPGSSSVRFYSTQSEPITEDQAFEDAFQRATYDFLFKANRLGDFSTNFDISKLKRWIHLHVEEAELCLFPDAQRLLIDTLVKTCFHNQEEDRQLTLMITTHSPYIINHLNVLLRRYTQHSEKAGIAPDSLGVYRIMDGSLQNLMGKDLTTGETVVNTLDLSETMNGIYQEYVSLAK